ncbi:Predicted nucleotidyltransferases [Legionella pneumophila]|uniref:nucleotidyltransferase domain-containing protein n=1 Tax=Legionella pneumophila TaxID=446 RepID=UPI0007708392|nr:nucleotidyltransferase domain-containing protein [Legionella pneumophila]CZG40149.1 Predicted nucleotidyltransferases [Legionella pneumophila]CZH41041.1 Predicted nucleotidyltransferases [Legionella pneumophila]
MIKHSSPLEDTSILEIASDLKEKHHCHTVILYGSRARGDYTDTSDYDIAGFRQHNIKERIAQKLPNTNVFLDIFLYPESELKEITDEHLCMHDGIVLFEKNKFGTNLLSKLKLIIFSPPPISENEIHVRKVWYEKMLQRASVGDLEGKYRQIWSLFTILEDYFIFKGSRYLGPKQAIQYLEKHDSIIYSLFNQALSEPGNLTALKKLIKAVIS